MSKTKQIMVNLLPFFVALVLVQILWPWSYLLLVLCLIIMTADILFGKDRNLEFKIAAFGVVWGAILEIFSTNISHFHSFPNPDILGIPLWLPVLWGYGFMSAKRIMSVIYTDSLWHNKNV